MIPNKSSIIIPVYNEEEILVNSIETVHKHLAQQQFDYEVILISNGSTDRTPQIGEELSKKYSWLKFFSIPQRGVGKAFALAVEKASGEHLICMDADLSSELQFIDYAHHLLNSCDMLIGSKSMGTDKRSGIRVLGSHLYIFLTQLLLGLNISDYSIGSKAFRKSAIFKTLPFLDHWTGYILELCLYLKVQGKRVMQIGVNCNDTRRSHFSLFYEGVYRYTHLIRCWKLIRNKSSWLYQAR